MARRGGDRHAAPDGSRARRAVAALLAALAALLVVRLTVGLAPQLFYGLVGGIVMSLLIVARDRLRRITPRSDGRERGTAPALDEPVGRNAGGDHEGR